MNLFGLDCVDWMDGLDCIEMSLVNGFHGMDCLD